MPAFQCTNTFLISRPQMRGVIQTIGNQESSWNKREPVVARFGNKFIVNKTASEEQQEWQSEDNYRTLLVDEYFQNWSSWNGGKPLIRSTRKQWWKQWGRRNWWWVQEWWPWLWRWLKWCRSCFYRLKRGICRRAASYNTLRTSSNKESWNWVFILLSECLLKGGFQLSGFFR